MQIQMNVVHSNMQSELMGLSSSVFDDLIPSTPSTVPRHITIFSTYLWAPWAY